MACPSARMTRPGVQVEHVAGMQNGTILARIPLRRADVADSTVAVIVVIASQDAASNPMANDTASAAPSIRRAVSLVMRSPILLVGTA
jgi:hypothetical protein